LSSSYTNPQLRSDNQDDLPREPIDIDANTLDDSADVEALKA
jgi:hypothetical protein